jgi:sugar-specific transcriptional regulator TrmB
MIGDSLKKLNFTDKEIDIYLGVLKNGKITHTDLAKYSGINRTTVYSVADELIKKGVIAEDLSGSTTYLIALPPEDLDNIIKKQQKEVEKQKKVVDLAIKELKKVAGEARYSVPKVRFIPDEDLENFLYKQTPKWLESLKKTNSAWLGFQDPTFVEHYNQWIDWQWKNSSKEIELKLLTNSVDIEKVMAKRKYPRRKIKNFKKNIPFTASTWVMGDYIVMLVTDKRPHYAIEIHNPVIAENQREVFKELWQATK